MSIQRKIIEKGFKLFSQAGKDGTSSLSINSPKGRIKVQDKFLDVSLPLVCYFNLPKEGAKSSSSHLSLAIKGKTALDRDLALTSIIRALEMARAQSEKDFRINLWEASNFNEDSNPVILNEEDTSLVGQI